MENKANWHYWNNLNSEEIKYLQKGIKLMKLQRDVFLDEVNKKLEKDKNIYVMSADFGAESTRIIQEKNLGKILFIAVYQSKLCLILALVWNFR